MPYIFLYGPPGTGKSTIGKILARTLNLPFVDLDRVIESKTGMAISQIMDRQGEPVFRNMETVALKEVVDDASSGISQVIALGGGALLRDENRRYAESHGTVVLLMVDLTILLERLKNDSIKRPLLEGDSSRKLTVLLDQRREHYSSFAIQCRVDGMTPAQSAWQIQTRLGYFHLAAMGAYDVLVQNEGIKHLGEMLRSRHLQNPIVVTDENVAKFHSESVIASLHHAGFDSKISIVPPGEACKNLETIQRLWHTFLEHGLDRKSTVVALGGGVIGDMAGFAASAYMRGIDWVCVPTTLLAMVDASLGGKTGFDLPEGKNLIGSFHPPRLVQADPRVLKTLPEAEFNAGLAEVVKHGIIGDPELFDLCARGLDCVQDNLEKIVKRAMSLKIKIIEDDPYEQGIRAVLNFGHTVGHAVELVSKFQLRHGEAVAIGMMAEAKLAERLAVAGRGLSEAIGDSLSKLGLPIHIPKDLPRPELIRAMRVDKKKSNGVIRFALPVKIGAVELVDVADLEMALEER